VLGHGDVVSHFRIICTHHYFSAIIAECKKRLDDYVKMGKNGKRGLEAIHRGKICEVWEQYR
jgi:hypothetical protein